MHSCLWEGLNLSQNCHPEIMSKLNHLSFPNLKILALSGNKISSLEELQWLDCPNLKHLDLSTLFFRQIAILLAICSH